jgi:hypothetical protein
MREDVAVPLVPSTWASVVSASIAPLAFVLSIYSAIVATHALDQTRNNNQLQNETALMGSSDSLQDQFKKSGIDDVPMLANFFYLLGAHEQAHTVPQNFYDQQIDEWCPITRQAHDKLKIAWVDDARFRDAHRETPWFLDMLDKLAGAGSDAKGGCR